VPKAEQHFRIKLGEQVVTPPDQPPVIQNPADPIKQLLILGNGTYEITIDFSALPIGTKFLKGQRAPGDVWVNYTISNTGKMTITNWPGGYFEFSFGTIDTAGVHHWADPVGQYVYPTNVPKAEQHFRIKLGEQVVTPPDQPPVVVPPVEPKHELSVVNKVMTVKFATVDGYIIELVKDGSPISLKVSDVKRIFWNGDVATWSLSDSNPYSVAVTLPENFAVSSIPVPSHDNGIIRIVDKSGGVYSMNNAEATGLSLTTDGRKLLTF
jgi:hypothetical protein